MDEEQLIALKTLVQQMVANQMILTARLAALQQMVTDSLERLAAC